MSWMCHDDVMVHGSEIAGNGHELASSVASSAAAEMSWRVSLAVLVKLF
jgi:hypothetical protein